MFIHTGTTQSQPSAHEQCVCRADSMLRKRPAAGAATKVHIPLLATRGKFLALNVLHFSALSDHRYLEHYNQQRQQQRPNWPDRRYCFMVRWLHWVHTGHILALHNTAGLDLYPVLPPNSSVWSRGRGKGRGRRVRAAIVHRGLCHIHLKSSPHSLLTDTLNDGPPNNTEQISLWAQVLDNFGRPPPLPSPFQIPARK